MLRYCIKDLTVKRSELKMLSWAKELLEPKAAFTLVRYWEKCFQKLPFSSSKLPFRPFLYTNPMKTRRENKNIWIQKQRWILQKQRHIAPIVFLGFSRVNSKNGSKPGKIHHCHVIFHVVQSWKTENGCLYSINAAVLRFACVCCLPAQHVSFVGGRIDVQKRTAEDVFGGLEFTRSYCEETSSSQAKSTTQVLG